MTIINLVAAQDSTALFKPKLSFGISIVHNFNFKPVSTTCDQVIPGLMYEAFIRTYYWQPSSELLYNYYLSSKHKVKNFFKNCFFSIGLRIRYEKEHVKYDTTCTFQGYSPFKIEKYEYKGILELPMYFNYEVNGLIFRAGSAPILLTYEAEKYTRRNDNSIHKINSWALFYGYITVRVDYTWVLRKNKMLFCFGYINRIPPNEFGLGLGIPLNHKIKE